jgi:hypothetical protein
MISAEQLYVHEVKVLCSGEWSTVLIAIMTFGSCVAGVPALLGVSALIGLIKDLLESPASGGRSF